MQTHTKRVVIAGLLGLTLCASAYAHEPSRPPGESILGGIVQERDVGLVFGYLRDVLSAAIEGREAAPPVEIMQRAESLGEELKRRGAAAGRAVIDAIEQTLREGLREPARPAALPPSSPSQRI